MCVSRDPLLLWIQRENRPVSAEIEELLTACAVGLCCYAIQAVCSVRPGLSRYSHWCTLYNPFTKHLHIMTFLLHSALDSTYISDI
jgi:hypothetical protein